MPTLQSRQYYSLAAPIPPADIDVLLDSSEYLVSFDVAANYEIGVSQLMQIEATNLGGAETYISIVDTLGLEYTRGGEVDISVDLSAAIVTFNGTKYDWPTIPWPDETWITVSYGVGDFGHELIP